MKGNPVLQWGDPWRVREDLICVNGYVRRDNYISTSYRDHQGGGGGISCICRGHCSGEGCLVHVTGTTTVGGGRDLVICRGHCSGEGCLAHVTGTATVREGTGILLFAGTTAVDAGQGVSCPCYTGTTTVGGGRVFDINRGHSSGEGCLVITVTGTPVISKGLYSGKGGCFVISVLHRGHQRGLKEGPRDTERQATLHDYTCLACWAIGTNELKYCSVRRGKNILYWAD